MSANLAVIIVGLGVDPNDLAQRIRSLGLPEIASVDVAADLRALQDAVRVGRCDVVLLDCDPHRQDLDLIQRYVRACGMTPVVAISRNDDLDVQERMLRLGVQDYLVKQKTYGRHLISSIIHSIERKRLEVQLKSTLGDLAQANARLRRLTLRDALTGTLNRRAFLAFAEQALARAERAGGRLALLYCDLDNFKEVNDSLGHSAGDDYLRAFCQRVHATLRRSDTLGRLGGDEFLVLLEDADWDQALETVQRVHRATSQPLEIEGRTLVPKVSIGVATYPNCATLTELIQRADAAMYAAKRRAASRGPSETGGADDVPEEETGASHQEST
jgi:diguanylate cyclase (GGDEF)-like protein